MSVVRTLLAKVPNWMIAVGDQGLVAVINLAMSVLITHAGGVSSLGRFAVITTTVLIVLGVARMWLSDPWLASRGVSTASSPELRFWTLVAAALATVAVTLVVAIACGGDPRWYVASAIAPLVVVQDVGRYLAFKQQVPDRAFLSDASILLVGALTFFALWQWGHTGLVEDLLCWLAGLLAGTAAIGRRLAGPIAWRGAWTWWSHYCRSLSTKLAHDSLAFLVGVNGSLYLLAYLGTQQDVGVVRIVQTVFSPVALTVTGLSMWLVPVLAQREAVELARLRRRATLVLATACVPMVVGAVVLGPWFARLVFGVDEAPDRLALWLTGLSTAASAIAAPWLASARVNGTYSPIAWARTAGAIAACVGLLVLPPFRGTNGYLAVIAVQSALVAAAAYAVGTRAAKQPAATTAPMRSSRASSLQEE